MTPLELQEYAPLAMLGFCSFVRVHFTCKPVHIPFVEDPCGDNVHLVTLSNGHASYDAIAQFLEYTKKENGSVEVLLGVVSSVTNLQA